MKLYGKQKVKRSVNKRVLRQVPDRDAIIWSVNLSQHYAFVKIQGSNTQIKAHYPANWNSTPYWLKPGNAVRIRHKAGNRGYIEIIGEGRAIPSPVSGDVFPTGVTPSDAILTGMRVRETSPAASQAVAIESGTFRISGVVYSFTATTTHGIVMSDPAFMVMTAAGSAVMGEGEYRVALGHSPDPDQHHYDLIVIGVDSIPSLVQGSDTPVGSEPTEPSIPANNLKLAHIFHDDCEYDILNSDINRYWLPPVPTQIGYSCSCFNCVLGWNVVDDYPSCVITLTIQDQYERSNTDANGVLVTITMYGTGTFQASQDASFHDSDTPGYGSILGDTFTFTYKRDQTESTESDPLFTVDVNGYPLLTTTVRVKLSAATTTTTTTTTSTTSTTTTVLLSEGLVGYYTMDDAHIAGSTLSDLSASSNDGTMVANPTTGQTGAIAESILFDPPQYVNLGDVSELEFSSGDFSISAWIHCTEIMDGAANTNYEIFNCESAASHGWILFIGNTAANHGKIIIRTNQSGSSDTVSTVGQVILADTWYHVVFTKDGSVPRIFVNKVSIHLDASTITSPAAGSTVKHIAGTDDKFEGYLDDVRFFNRALTQANINELYSKSVTTTTTTT